MIRFYKRKPKEEAVSKAEHEAAMEWHIDNTQAWRDRLRSVKNKLDVAMCKVTDLTRELEQERETVGRLVAKIRDLEPDARKYREKCQRDREYHANRRQSRDKQAAE